MLELLLSISNNHFDLPDGHDRKELTRDLLTCLASTDAKTRELSAEILYQWLNANKGAHYTNAELLVLTQELTEKLFIGLGEGETDHSYLRAFAVLIVACLTDLDSKRQFLSEVDFKLLFTKTLVYFEQENDYRSRTTLEKGWVHAVAHCADLLEQLAKHPKTNKADLLVLLNAISKKVRHTSYYFANEDERFANTVIAVLRRPEYADFTREFFFEDSID